MGVHVTFHVSMLKKNIKDANLIIRDKLGDPAGCFLCGGSGEDFRLGGEGASHKKDPTYKSSMQKLGYRGDFLEERRGYKERLFYVVCNIGKICVITFFYGMVLVFMSLCCIILTIIKVQMNPK